MVENSLPWAGIAIGDAGRYSHSDWQNLYRYLGMHDVSPDSGLLQGSIYGSVIPPLWVQENSPADGVVIVKPGSAMVRGIFYQNDGDVELTVAGNSSGNPRIDTIILRATYGLQTVRLAILTGTPAAFPSRPALTQSGAIWEIPVAEITVADGFLIIEDVDIFNYGLFGNVPASLYHENVLNNSGGELRDGDVVVWDATVDRAVKTTTTENDDDVAGVWQGTTANLGYGRVLYEGIGFVQVSTSIARNAMLVTSTTAKKAVIANSTGGEMFARTLESLASAGRALCHVGHHQKYNPPNSGAILTRSSVQSISNGTETSINWTTALESINEYWDVANPERMLIPLDGVYMVNFQAAFTPLLAMDAYIYKNGTTTRLWLATGTGDATQWTQDGVTVSLVRQFTAGEYLIFRVKQESGLAKDLKHQDDTVGGMTMASIKLLWEI